MSTKLGLLPCPVSRFWKLQALINPTKALRVTDHNHAQVLLAGFQRSGKSASATWTLNSHHFLHLATWQQENGLIACQYVLPAVGAGLTTIKLHGPDVAQRFHHWSLVYDSTVIQRSEQALPVQHLDNCVVLTPPGQLIWTGLVQRNRLTLRVWLRPEGQIPPLAAVNNEDSKDSNDGLAPSRQTTVHDSVDELLPVTLPATTPALTGSALLPTYDIMRQLQHANFAIWDADLSVFLHNARAYRPFRRPSSFRVTHRRR